MDILANINKWFDSWSDQKKTVAWIVTLIISALLTFFGYIWVAGIFILGLAIDKVWWEFFATKTPIVQTTVTVATTPTANTK